MAVGNLWSRATTTTVSPDLLSSNHLLVAVPISVVVHSANVDYHMYSTYSRDTSECGLYIRGLYVQYVLYVRIDFGYIQYEYGCT